MAVAMRRQLSAIFLLALFSAPLITPVLRADSDPDSKLPPCCRRGGEHPCSQRASDSGDPAFQAAPCASYPTFASAPTEAKVRLLGSSQFSISLSVALAPQARAAAPAVDEVSGAVHSRGPPSLL